MSDLLVVEKPWSLGKLKCSMYRRPQCWMGDLGLAQPGLRHQRLRMFCLRSYALLGTAGCRPRWDCKPWEKLPGATLFAQTQLGCGPWGGCGLLGTRAVSVQRESQAISKAPLAEGSDGVAGRVDR